MPGQFVCPNSDTICPNSDKKYLTILTLDFFYYFLLVDEKRDSFLPSGSWIVLFWLPAETLSLKRLPGYLMELYNDGCEDDPLSTSVVYIIGMRLRVSIMRRPWIQTIDEITNEYVWTKAKSQSFRASKSMA